MKQLNVYLNDQLAGKIWLDENSQLFFQYDQKYCQSNKATPLSYQLPVTPLVYAQEKAKPFFANILPEGELRQLIAKTENISERNDLALLEKLGGECAGAVSILPADLRPILQFKYTKISDQELDQMLAKEKRLPLVVQHKELRLSLAGVQDKLPIYIKDQQLYLSVHNSPSSHILKPDNKYFPGLIYNELFCQLLAKEIGLNVPAVFLWQTNHYQAYIIERYDRKYLTNKIARLHQEDFCQALGYLPEQKYENEGGPGVADCFKLITAVSVQPLIARDQLMKWIIFNYLIGNADAHAKNLSILYKNKNICLAPFYDLVSTQIYPELSQKMSMKIGGENRFNWIKKRHWQLFAQDIGIKEAFVLKNLNLIATALLKRSENVKAHIVKKYGDNIVLQEIIKQINSNVAKMKDNLIA